MEDKSDQQFGRALRRARVDVIFDEYESEIKKLQDEVKVLRSRETDQGLHARQSVQTSTSKEDIRKTENVSPSLSERSREQVIQQLTMKLKAAKTASEKIKREMDGLKEANTKLRDENVSLSIENGRLKHSLATRSPRKFEKYAQAALQRRIDQAEKEIGQLKKALTRSDSCIEEQESKLKAYQERFGDFDVKVSACKETSIHQSDYPSSEFTQFRPSLDCYEADVEHTPLKEEGASKGIVGRGNLHQEDNMLNPRGKFFSFTSGGGSGFLTSGSGDGPSPAKRRLYLEDDDSATKGAVSKNCRYLRREMQMSSFADINKSELEGRPNSNECSTSCLSLERQSPAELTPSTSFGKLQIDKKYDSSEVEDFRLTPRSNTDDREKLFNANIGSGPCRVPKSLSLAWDDEDTSSDLEDERCLSMKGESKEASSDLELKRNGIDNKLDSTLSNLDFTLTPEFVDCTKLLKAAEERVNGKLPDKGSTSSAATS